MAPLSGLAGALERMSRETSPATGAYPSSTSPPFAFLARLAAPFFLPLSGLAAPDLEPKES